MTAEANRSLCRAFFDAVTAGDIEAVGRLLAPDMVSWQNVRGTETPAAVLLPRLAGIPRVMNSLHYEDIACEATSEGFVERHTACFTSPEGTPVRIPAVVVGLVKGGKITRIDEYVDSAGPR